VTLIDPRGRRLNLRYGRFGGYWDYGTVTRRYAPNILSNPVAGVYRFILEVKVDHQYPDIRMVGANNPDWPRLADRWVQYRPGGWKIHVYSCR
jgi:hypothetical protein